MRFIVLFLLFCVGYTHAQFTFDMFLSKPTIQSACMIGTKIMITYTTTYTGVGPALSFRIEYVQRAKSTQIVASTSAIMYQQYSETIPLGTCSSNGGTTTVYPITKTLLIDWGSGSFLNPWNSYDMKFRLQLSQACLWTNTGANSEWSDYYSTDPINHTPTFIGKDITACPSITAITGVCYSTPTQSLRVNWTAPTVDRPPFTQVALQYTVAGGIVAVHTPTCNNQSAVLSMNNVVIPVNNMATPWGTEALTFAIGLYTGCPLLAGTMFYSPYFTNGTDSTVAVYKSDIECWEEPEPPAECKIYDLGCHGEDMLGIKSLYIWFIVIGGVLAIVGVIYGFYTLIMCCVDRKSNQYTHPSNNA